MCRPLTRTFEQQRLCPGLDHLLTLHYPKTGERPRTKERREGSASQGGQDRRRAVYEAMGGARRNTRLSAEGWTVSPVILRVTVQNGSSGPVQLFSVSEVKASVPVVQSTCPVATWNCRPCSVQHRHTTVVTEGSVGRSGLQRLFPEAEDLQRGEALVGV